MPLSVTYSRRSDSFPCPTGLAGDPTQCMADYPIGHFPLAQDGLLLTRRVNQFDASTNLQRSNIINIIKQIELSTIEL